MERPACRNTRACPLQLAGRLSVLLFALTLAPAVRAQGWLLELEDLSWYQPPDGLAPCDDGGMIVTGRVASPSSNGQAGWYAKLDGSGQVVWQYQLQDSDWGKIIGVLTRPDGSHVAMAMLNDQPTAIAFDDAGALLWQVALPVTAFPFSGEVGPPTLAADGSLLTAGVTWNGFTHETWVANVDVAGNLRWMRQLLFDLGSGGTDQVPRVAAAPNGDIIVCGYEGDLLRMDASGALLWHHDLADSGRFGAVVALAGGDVVVSGYISMFPAPAFLARIRADGTLAWQQLLVSPYGTSARFLAPAPGGEILVIGSVRPWGNHAGSGLWVATLTDDGTITSQRVIGSPTSWHDGVRAAYLADGSLAVVGSSGYGSPVLARLPAGSGLPLACGFEAPTAVVTVASTLALPAGSGFVANAPGVGMPAPATRLPATVRVRVACSPAGCTTDAAEPEGFCGGVRQSLVPDEPWTGNFCDDATDYFFYRTCPGEQVVLETSGLGVLADTLLELWSADCSTLLAMDDNGGAEPRASRIAWTPASTETLRVAVHQVGGLAGPDREYTLVVTGTSCAPSTWLRTYEDSAESRLSHVKVSGSEISAAGYPREPSDLGGGWDFRLDLDGNVLRRAELGAGEAGRAYDIAVLPDGSRIVVGKVSLMAGRLQDFPWMQRLDASGAEIWSRRLATGSLDGSLTSIEPTSDGAFIVAGSLEDRESRFPTPRTPSRAVALRLRSDGTIVWQKAIGAGTADLLLEAMVELGDGTLLGVGRVSQASSYSNWIVALDAGGNSRWQALHPTAQTWAWGYKGRAVEVDAAGRGLVAFHVIDTWLAALDPGGTLAWQRTLGPAGGDTMALHGDADGGSLLLDGGYLFRLASAGDVEWSRYIYGASQLRDVARASDDGVVVVGEASAASGVPSAFVAKLDGLGRATGNCALVSELSLGSAPAAAVLVPVNYLVSNAGLGVIDHAARPIERTTNVEEACSSNSTCTPATLTLSGPPVACVGQSIDLEAIAQGTPGLLLEWDLSYDFRTFVPEATGERQSVVPVAAGLLYVACRLTDGCSDPGPQVVLRSLGIRVGAAVPVAITGASRRCDSDACTVLQATPGQGPYAWSSGETTESICVQPAASTTYTVTAGIPGGCPATSAPFELIVGTPSTVDVVATCEAGVLTVTASASGGTAPLLYSWGTGESGPVLTPAAVPATHVVTVTDAGGCATVAQIVVTGTECADLGEVSGPGAPQLRVTRAAGLERVHFESLPRITRYNLHVGTLGAWLSDAGATARDCALADGSDQGDGTLAITRSLPVDSWFVVTASNALGEGPAGLRSTGLERALAPGWAACGAAP